LAGLGPLQASVLAGAGCLLTHGPPSPAFTRLLPRPLWPSCSSRLLPHGRAGTTEAGETPVLQPCQLFILRVECLLPDGLTRRDFNVLLACFHSKVSFLERNGEAVVLGIRVQVYLHGALAVVWWLADAPGKVISFCNERSRKLL